MKALVNFLFETGMLKKTPRSGFQFLGSGKESVAEHSFRTAVIAYALSSREEKADSHKAVLMCLFHDLHEARTGDLNYVNKRYVKADEEGAVRDLAEKLPFGKDLIDLAKEFNAGESLEARISKDADQLDLILSLKEQQDIGNPHAKEWLTYALQRLQTKSARKLAEQILVTESTDWWFEKDTDWWVNGTGNGQNRKE
ncbi:MAG: HD domain-containing protein [Desulfobacteraceae bacterium]|nr:MAG: HD domain-containing protein [Desulfobacteraceae bacterium]